MSMKEVSKKERTDRLRRNEKKWTPEVMAAGWTVIPSVILERQRAFGLDAVDINILLHLAQFWWQEENPPHPTKGTIAASMNVHARTVQRHIARLEREGLIQREEQFSPTSGRQKANRYLFNGLIEKAKPLAEELIAKRRERREEDAARRTKRVPNKLLVFVDPKERP